MKYYVLIEIDDPKGCKNTPRWAWNNILKQMIANFSAEREAEVRAVKVWYEDGEACAINSLWVKERDT